MTDQSNSSWASCKLLSAEPNHTHLQQEDEGRYQRIAVFCTGKAYMDIEALNLNSTVDAKKLSADVTVTYNWVEITDDFFTATKELKLGELLHDEMFGLFEAMSAIEMMDPKMDAGMICNRGSKKAFNFDQAVAANVLKLKDLTVEEQIGIIDATLACLVTWLEGHSLAQTVLTNLYLHKPCMIEDRCIKAFSICTLKLVELIKDFVNKALVFEEEDFQPVVYGYKLASDVFDARATGMMKEVEDELQRKVKTTRSKQGEDWDESTQKQHREAVALYSRIKFCRLFYQALLVFSRKESSRIEDAQKFLTTCCELLPVINSTVHLGLQPEPASNSSHRSIDYPIIMGFEPLVNQRLLPPTFPRYIKIKSREEAIAYFEALVHRLKIVCNVITCQSFQLALNFFIEFSKLSPCVLSRSIAQLLYLPQSNKAFGVLPMCDVLRDAARTFICPPALAPRSTLLNNPQTKEYVETFLNHCVRPFSNLIQICGHNRARQRDKMAQILEEFANLQDEADKVDAYLHSLFQKLDCPRQHLACFGTWVLYHTLKIMILYVLSGFELELYSTHEYHYVFWYLFEFLYGWMVSALSRADGFLLEQESAVEQQKGRNAKKNKKKKKLHPHGREITINQACHNLCAGFCKALEGFNLDGKLKTPDFQFDCEQVRYEHRFAPFGNVMTPPPVQYQQYKEMTNMNRFEIKPTAVDLYMAACKYFHQAKTLFENVPNPTEEIGSLIKVSKTNFIVMKLLSGGHKKDSTDSPEFDFTTHKTFPIIKIV